MKDKDVELYKLMITLEKIEKKVDMLTRNYSEAKTDHCGKCDSSCSIEENLKDHIETLHENSEEI